MKILFGLISFFLFATTALGDWSANLGANNPPASDLGLNFLYQPSELALEIGIGRVSTDVSITNDDQDNDAGTAAIAGDIDLKYYFKQSSFEPYLSAGLLYGFFGRIGDDGGLGIGTGETFLGGGVKIGNNKLYAYGGINLIHSHLELNFGAGIDL